MNEIQNLYHELIIDHGTQPRNFHILAVANHTAEGFNPLCGDKMTLYVLIENNIIKDVAFQGTGCAISIASASLMTEMLKGQTIENATNFFYEFQTLLTQETTIPSSLPIWQKLHALTGVRAYPARVKCATLAWHTLQAALNRHPKVSATE